MTPTSKLIASAKTGCIRSRGELLRQYRGYLKTLARVQLHPVVGVKADASDLVQETCLVAHEGFDRFRGTTEAEFSSWLRSILASRLAKLVRFHAAQKRSVALERELYERLDRSSMALGQVLVHPGPSPSEVAAQRENARLVADAIENLAEDYRTVILLRHVEGLPYADIAKEMQRSVDSVKKLWVRALAQLQRSVEARQ